MQHGHTTALKKKSNNERVAVLMVHVPLGRGLVHNRLRWMLTFGSHPWGTPSQSLG